MAAGLLLFSQMDSGRLDTCTPYKVRVEEIHDFLRDYCRKQQNREVSPSLGLIDSQSVKSSSMTSEKGYDGGKKVQGRKRHIVTDTLGLIMAVVVHSADTCTTYEVRVYKTEKAQKP